MLAARLLVAWLWVLLLGVGVAAAQEGGALAPAPSAAPTTAAAPGGLAPASGAQPVGSVDLVPEDCEGTNRALWMATAIIDVATVAFFFLVFWWVNRKDWIKPGGLVRFLVVLLPFLAVPAVVLILARPETEIVSLCVARSDYRHLIVMVEQPEWQQGVILGSGPVLVLAVLGVVVHALFRRRR